jgi:hypothetical protein
MMMGKTNGQWLEIWRNVSRLNKKQGRKAVEEYAKGLNIKHCRKPVVVSVEENFVTGRTHVDFKCTQCDRSYHIDVPGYRFKREDPVSIDYVRECLKDWEKIHPEIIKFNEQEQEGLIKLAWFLFNAYDSTEEAMAALRECRNRFTA